MTNKTELLPQKNFDFIDSIRCISMMFIVLEHCTHVGTYIFDGITTMNVFYMSLIQLSKAGTIIFFILAGFLLGEKFFTYSPLEYFRRRVKIIFTPWLFWSLVFVFAMTYKNWIIYRKNLDFNGVDNLLESFRVVYLYSNYWFIVNFLICIGILLMFRKYLYSYRFGAILFGFTVLYSANIYLEWFPPHHTMAIFGFVFFLWLGAMFNKHWQKVSAFMASVSMAKLTLLFLATFAAAVLEIIFLYDRHALDPYNTLRFTNIIYSVATFLLLIKVKDLSFVNVLKPRETTFGIYLIHYIMVFNILPEILRPFKFSPVTTYPIIGFFALTLLKFLIVYSLTFMVVRLINRTRFKWLIGR